MTWMDAVLTELREQWLVVAIMGSVSAWVAVACGVLQTDEVATFAGHQRTFMRPS